MAVAVGLVQWVREPSNRWMPCSASCTRSGRWMLEIWGHPTGGPLCDSCRTEMQAAWDGAHAGQNGGS